MKKALSVLLALLLTVAAFSSFAFTLDIEKAKNAQPPSFDPEFIKIVEYPENAGLDIVGTYDGTALNIRTKAIPQDVIDYAIARFSGYQLLKTHIQEIGMTEATVKSLRLGQAFCATDLEQGDIGIYHFPVLDGNKIIFIFTVYPDDGEYHATFGQPNIYNALNNSYGIKGPVEIYRTADGFATVSADGEIFVTYIFNDACSSERTPEDAAKTIKAQVALARFSLLPSEVLHQSKTISVGSNSLLSSSAALSIADDQITTQAVPTSYTIPNFPWTANFKTAYLDENGLPVEKDSCWAASDCSTIQYIYIANGLTNYPIKQDCAIVGLEYYFGAGYTGWGGVLMQTYVLSRYGITPSGSLPGNTNEDRYIDPTLAKSILSGNGPIIHNYLRVIAGNNKIGHAVVLRGYTADNKYFTMDPNVKTTSAATYYVDIATHTLHSTDDHLYPQGSGYLY